MNRALNVFLFKPHAEQKMMNPLASPSAAKRNRLALADCFLSVLSSRCMVRFFKADTHLSTENGFFRGTVVFCVCLYVSS